MCRKPRAGCGEHLTGGRVKVANIHARAIVSPQAHLGQDVMIGPFCIVDADVVLGDGCRLESNVVIQSGVLLGENNHICEGAVIGGLAQHTNRPVRAGTVRIGSNNSIREFVTIHRALEEGQATTIGDDNLLMISAHVAHDCSIGNSVIVTNNVMLAGHVSVGDQAYLAGAVGVHQFCRIGRLAMVGRRFELGGLAPRGFHEGTNRSIESGLPIDLSFGLAMAADACPAKNRV